MFTNSHLTLRIPPLLAVGRAVGGRRGFRVRAPNGQSLPASSLTAADANSPSLQHRYAVKTKRALYARTNHDNNLQSSKVSTFEAIAIGNISQDPSLPTRTHNEKEAILERLLQNPGKIDVEKFTNVFTSLWDKKIQTDFARRAEIWMSRLEARLSDDTASNRELDKNAITSVNQHIKPMLQCYAFVIQCWAESLGDDPVIAVGRAENWLQKARRLSSNAPPRPVAPLLTQCYNAFLDTCSRGRDSKQVRRSAPRTHAKKAEDTLCQMLEENTNNGAVVPNTESVNFVMRAIAHAHADPSIAIKNAQLLKMMEDSCNGQPIGKDLVIHPNAKSYSIWLSSLAKVAREKAKIAQQYSRQQAANDGTNDIKVLQEALDHMVRLFRKGRLGVLEDNVPHNTLLTAWAGISGQLNGVDGPMNAEKVFRTMVELSQKDLPEAAPDATSYLQILRAWAKSGSDRAGEKASWWLDRQWREFEQQGNREDLMPTTKAYTEAIIAWGSVGEANKAEELFIDLLQRFKSSKAPQLKTNTEVYAALIRAWLHAAEFDEAGQERQIARLRRGVEWLQSMMKEEKAGGPATRHDLFVSVLKSAKNCAFDSPEVLDIAYRTFRDLRDSRHHIDPRAYSALLEVALLALAKPENDDVRTQFVKRLVTACCEDGLLSKPLVAALSNGPVYRQGWTRYESARITQMLFPEVPVPPTWTRNVKQHQMRPEVEDFKRKEDQK